MAEITDFQIQAASAALNKMFSDSYFSIATFDSIAKVLGAQVSGRDYDALRLLNLVEWDDMQEPLRSSVTGKVIELLGILTQTQIVGQGKPERGDQGADKPANGGAIMAVMI